MVVVGTGECVYGQILTGEIFEGTQLFWIRGQNSICLCTDLICFRDHSTHGENTRGTIGTSKDKIDSSFSMPADNT